MTKEYTPEQINQLLKNLPLELREAFSSIETGEHIWDICEKNRIDEISGVAKIVGNVLLGLLPPNEFQETLEKELDIETETAKKVAREINRFIFYPVRPFLERIYNIKPEKESEKPGQKAAETEEKSADEKDIYREPI